MRNPFRKPSAPEPGRPVGVVRVDARTKKLAKHLRAGEFAVIVHAEIDFPHSKLSLLRYRLAHHSRQPPTPHCRPINRR